MHFPTTHEFANAYLNGTALSESTLFRVEKRIEGYQIMATFALLMAERDGEFTQSELAKEVENEATIHWFAPSEISSLLGVLVELGCLAMIERGGASGARLYVKAF